jgi:hypothetical protein
MAGWSAAVGGFQCRSNAKGMDETDGWTDHRMTGLAGVRSRNFGPTRKKRPIDPVVFGWVVPSLDHIFFVRLCEVSALSSLLLLVYILVEVGVNE